MNLDECSCGARATRWLTRMVLPNNGRLILRYFTQLFPYCDFHASQIMIAGELTREEAELWSVHNS